MLLKRRENDNKIKAMYSSSTIVASIFETDTKNLTVIFKNGGQYKYTSVSDTDYMRFELADSQGTILNSHIKKYTFEKLAPVDTTLIIKEIEELKAADDKASTETRTKAMLSSMSTLIASYITTGKVDYDSFRKVETKIAEYNKVANPQPTQQVVS